MSCRFAEKLLRSDVLALIGVEQSGIGKGYMTRLGSVDLDCLCITFRNECA